MSDLGNVSPEEVRVLRDAQDLFLSAVEDHEDTVFFQLTHRETCYLHFCTLLARISAAASAASDPQLGELVAAMREVETELWEKLFNVIRVQQLGLEPEDL